MPALILDFFSGIRWIDVENTSGEVIPAFAVIRPNGKTATGQIKAAKPNADGQAGCLINGPYDIPIGKKGRAHNDTPHFVLYDDGDGAPAALEAWGPGNASWKLRKGNDGFLTVGDAASGRVLAIRHECCGGFSGARVNIDTTISGYTSNTNIDFTDEEWDTEDYWDAGDPDLFTVPSNGYYHFDASVFVDATGATPGSVYLLVFSDVANGASGGHLGADAGLSQVAGMTVSRDLRMLAGETVWVRVQMATGVTIDITYASMNIHRLGDYTP